MKIKYKTMWAKYTYNNNDEDYGCPIIHRVAINVILKEDLNNAYTDEALEKVDKIALQILGDDNYVREQLPIIEVEV